jgi:hypothetical protein
VSLRRLTRRQRRRNLRAVEDNIAPIQDRISRAKEHLEAVKGELVGYYNSDPCRLSGQFKPDPDGRRGSGEWHEGELAPLPARLNTLIGELLHDSRSALDHLAWQLVLHNGGQPTGATNFPILKVAPTSDKQRKRPLPNLAGGASKAARALIDAAQPYQLGDGYAEHPLWVLHQLWNIDKHRHVIAKGTRTEAHFIGDVPAFSFTSRFDSATELCAKITLVPDDPKVHVNAYTLVEVAIQEPIMAWKRRSSGRLKQSPRRLRTSSTVLSQTASSSRRLLIPHHGGIRCAHGVGLHQRLYDPARALCFRVSPAVSLGSIWARHAQRVRAGAAWLRDLAAFRGGRCAA